MPRPLASLLHAICATLILAMVAPALAQTKPPSLLGETREQVLDRFGEPKSQIVAGPRSVLFFARIKVTFKNGVVIETEDLPDESPPKRVVEAAAPAATATDNAAVAQAASAVASNIEGVATVAPAKPAAPVAPPKAPAPEGPLQIRPARPPSAAARLASKSAPTVTAAPLEAVVAVPAKAAAPAAGEAKSSTTPGAAPEKTAPASTALGDSATPSTTTKDVLPETTVATDDEEKAKAEADEKAKAAAKKKAIGRLRRIRIGRDPTSEDVSLFSTSTYVFAAAVIGSVIFLFWRRTQRRLELDATTVSHTPFGMEKAVDTGALFTVGLLASLSTRRFEEVVASYYAKTGVVAERTNAGAGEPVHIKIFWEGELKPFAGVQCHASPPGLIGLQPLQDLYAALAAAEIRRGYVVTTGRFNVESRDFAEEKHFTLLPGDIFLEKLNALPPAARAELLKEASALEAVAPSTTVAT
ncbi:MAG: restriction endonuclease [Opitutus sp.]|nr:restriction endonuclease [Opitutus sp.]